MTTKKTTARKAPTRKPAEQDTTKLTGPEVTVKTDEELAAEEKTPAQVEVEAEATEDAAFTTFTVEVNGQEIELENRWTRDTPPGAMMFLGNDKNVEKYGPGLVEQLIGEDQIFMLMSAGADAREIAGVTRAWVEARGLKN